MVLDSGMVVLDRDPGALIFPELGGVFSPPRVSYSWSKFQLWRPVSPPPRVVDSGKVALDRGPGALILP